MIVPDVGMVAPINCDFTLNPVLAALYNGRIDPSIPNAAEERHELTWYQHLPLAIADQDIRLFVVRDRAADSNALAEVAA